MSVSCSSCRFAELLVVDGCDHEDGPVPAVECRRFPPQVTCSAEDGGLQSWPTVQESDWCGEWKQS